MHHQRYLPQQKELRLRSKQDLKFYHSVLLPLKYPKLKEFYFTTHILGAGNDEYSVHCETELIDRRLVTSSNGETELRCVIKTRCHIGSRAWKIELTLTNRSSMRFRMLLGRKAMKRHAIVDPGSSFLQGIK